MIPEQAARQAVTLARQGWTVSGIARHLGHDRRTIRIYVNGSRAPGHPRPHADSFAPYAGYVRQRAGDDRHLRATGLHREITALGYTGSYSAFTPGSAFVSAVLRPFADDAGQAPAALDQFPAMAYSLQYGDSDAR